MTNILEAIYNITQRKELKVKEITFGKNRANNMGEGLESCCRTFDERDSR